MKYRYLMSFLLISLPGGDVTNAMASVLGRFYRGSRLPYHDFESQAFALHAHSFKAPLNFFWKTQKKSFCFFWLQKDKHKKYPCYFPPPLTLLLKYINLQYLTYDLLHCLLYLRTYVLLALGTARVLKLHFKYQESWSSWRDRTMCKYKKQKLKPVRRSVPGKTLFHSWSQLKQIFFPFQCELVCRPNLGRTYKASDQFWDQILSGVWPWSYTASLHTS